MHYDVIIIGSGAGGGSLAYALATTGRRILLLERGESIPKEDANWNPAVVHRERRYAPAETWYDDQDRPQRCPTFYNVGGNTKWFGAVLMRFRAEDFEGMRHYDGMAPAWPIRYADLEPYYTQAEHLYQVRGVRGIDPTEPCASAPYAYGPLHHEPRIQQLADDLTHAGLHPFPLPVGIMRDDAAPERQPCRRCAMCGGYPCKVAAKCDAETIAVAPALQFPNVTLLTGAMVTRLETDASGRSVTMVHVRRGNEEERYHGSIIVLAAGAINSAALLLRSKSDRHPDGLANRSGVVGRHYMRHIKSSIIAITREPHSTVFQKTLGWNDWYFGDEGWDFPLGHVQTLGKPHPSLYAEDDIPAGLTRDTFGPHTLDLVAFSEDLPDPGNRITLTRDGSIRVAYTPNNTTGHRRLIKRLDTLLPSIGCVGRLSRHDLYVGQTNSVNGANHQCGTVRFGVDPTTSALDVWCRAHDLDNLYVVDASFMPSSTASNPALTIIANALRVANHLRERFA
jgi:choline dehydrogenase-like flavoprotein